jgi:chemotaxis protein MotB
MRRHLCISLAILAAGVIASGCFNSGTVKKMEAENKEEIAALQQEKTTLEKENTDLKQQVASLKQHNEDIQWRASLLAEDKARLIANNRGIQKQYEALLQDLSKQVEKGQLQVKQYKNMLSVDLTEQIFFDSGKATLKKEGKDVLRTVGNVLKGYDSKVIRVVGHTDNVPVAKTLQATFPSNWELSVIRATNVVRFLQEVGVPPERMLAAGRAEYDPVASNDTPEGRQKNRRIEIMLIDKDLVSEMTKTGN